MLSQLYLAFEGAVPWDVRLEFGQFNPSPLPTPHQMYHYEYLQQKNFFRDSSGLRQATYIR